MERLTGRRTDGQATIIYKSYSTTQELEKALADIVSRLAELEDELESGQLVELPKDKWAITVGGSVEQPNYMIEHRNPIAEYYQGIWHIYFETIQWRDILCEFPTKDQAEARLKELQEQRK